MTLSELAGRARGAKDCRLLAQTIGPWRDCVVRVWWARMDDVTQASVSVVEALPMET
jgi:hypothetical protein